MAYPELCMIIDGERIPVGHRRTHTVINPATLERLGELPLADAADLDRALDAAARGFATWRKSTPEQRSAVLLGAASIMAARAEDIARVATAAARQRRAPKTLRGSLRRNRARRWPKPEPKLR